MKKLALVVLALALTACGPEHSGTRDDPIPGKVAGRFCSAPGQYAYDKDGALLRCQRKATDAAPRWTHVGD